MGDTKFPAHHIRISACLIATVTASIALAACSSSSSTSTGASQPANSNSGTKLILFELAFPCGLNSGISELCSSVTAQAAKLPPGYTVEIKNAVDNADNSAFNSLIQTSLQLNPAGLIVFPAGPAAQTPVLNQACDKGVKVVIMESPATGVKCQSSFVGTNNAKLGEEDAQWLIAHPPASKQVGIVTQPPGEYVSTDQRVQGFTKTITAAGYQIVATATTNLSVDTTRTAVTNMVTAHPQLGAIFSANGPIGDGTQQALVTHPGITQLTLDGQPNDVHSILNGTIGADAVSDVKTEGQLAVTYAAAAVQGHAVPATAYVPSEVIDKANAQQYLAASGQK